MRNLAQPDRSAHYRGMNCVAKHFRADELFDKVTRVLNTIPHSERSHSAASRREAAPNPGKADQVMTTAAASSTTTIIGTSARGADLSPTRRTAQQHPS
jgi:hypothetical protein